MVQVVQVVQGCAVPGVPGGGTRGLYSSPVPPPHRTLPANHSACRTTSTRRKASKPEPWPPAELCLPNLDELERISRGGAPEPEPPSPHDAATRAKCLFPLDALPELVSIKETRLPEELNCWPNRIGAASTRGRFSASPAAHPCGGCTTPTRRMTGRRRLPT